MEAVRVWQLVHESGERSATHSSGASPEPGRMADGTRLADTAAHMTRLTTTLACGALLLGLARCQPQADAGSSFAREETLYLGGQQWGEPTSFNPLVSSPDCPASGASGAYNLLYEPLLLFHPGSGAIAPWLASSYAVRDGAIEVVMDPAARWNDGR